MNTIQIDEKLKHIPTFLGAFPYDQLPKSKKHSYSLIINTEPSTAEGDHWLALIFREKKF